MIEESEEHMEEVKTESEDVKSSEPISLNTEPPKRESSEGATDEPVSK